MLNTAMCKDVRTSGVMVDDPSPLVFVNITHEHVFCEVTKCHQKSQNKATPGLIHR